MARGATPLWPAGHLPLKGGDRSSRLPSPITKVAKEAPRAKLPISPLEGEMAGRPEGGAVAPTLQSGGTLWAR
ncbi:MAG: lytic murein transglycosylase [Mesorhizobium sp.]|nr:MAG: lytic murein transglycosylase [Mesorhizobium sp.]TJV50955.1 MAG: lytic murein transglycosylase [Mesorhizobium sp.]